MIISTRVILLSFSLFVSTIISLPTCHDTIPFSTKFNQSSLIVYGDIIKTSTPLSSQPFNITFLVKCILKGDPPINETIIIEHSLPENPICYRTLINGYTYVYFLRRTNNHNYYQQMPFHELSFNDDTTAEVLRRTCGIQTRPFRAVVKKNGNDIIEQCPIVSIGCTEQKPSNFH